MSENQCINSNTCTSDQDPTTDSCNPDDGYIRTRLYKTYSLTCSVLNADFNTYYYFPWEHHGNWPVGSQATLKCLPGYVLPKAYKPPVNLPTYDTSHITNNPNKWYRLDGYCGNQFKYNDNTPAECDPNSINPCCWNINGWGVCGPASNTYYENYFCKCVGCHDFRTSVPKFNLPALDFDKNTQTVDCVYDATDGGTWSPSPVKCEPSVCKDPNDLIPAGNTDLEIAYSPSTTINQYFETLAYYKCPLNTSIPDLLLDEMSFDYSNSFGIVPQINLTCGLDENWVVSGGPVGETCEGATGNEERCYSPIIPDCVDKNKYCSYPPMAPKNGKMIEMNRPLDDYLTVPSTTLYYYCPTPQWAFDYTYDTSLPSFYFTKNVNNITATCNDAGFWDVDYQIEGETCINKQPSGACEKLFIPECVDRNVYCSDLSTPTDSSRLILNQPNPLSEKVYSTKIELSCPEINWYFDYALPTPFISFYFSTNINKATFTCNQYGVWTVEGGLDGETCTDYISGDNDLDQSLLCSFLNVPACVDRTVRCSPPPNPVAKSDMVIIDRPNPNAMDEMGTVIEYSCPDRMHYFDYPVEEPFISFYYTTNIDYINVTCNLNGEWDVNGGQDGLTCDDTDSNSTELTCGPLSIPDCVDRTVYCVFPPASIAGGDITINQNPSPSYKKQSQCNWGRWFNANDNVGGKGDFEIITEINGKFGTMACANPDDIKARVKETKQEVPKQGGPQVYSKYDKINGFTCLNKDQTDGQCLDYEVSLCCPPGPENGTVLTLQCNVDDWYLDYKDLPFTTSIQITCTDNSTWITDTITTDFCRDGTQQCEFPKLPDCNDRTVLCLDKLPLPDDMIRTNLTTNETLHLQSIGAKYSYACLEDGFVIDMPGYPEEVLVECINPLNYFSDWKYELWREGIWTNYGNLTKCIDPLLCYDEIPDLPVDFTVSNNQTKDKPNVVNTTIQYMCSRNCKYIITVHDKLTIKILMEYFADWVFNIKDLYKNCDMEPENCEAQGFELIYTFDKSIDATNILNVTCEEGFRSDGLPDWVWRLDGFDFVKYMPSCFDPTYCEDDPPHVSNAIYNPPPKGTVRYKDGEQVTYICENPGITIPSNYCTD